MEKSLASLENIAKVLRKDIVKMVTESASGHPGGSLSAVEIITTLYFSEMNINVEDPKDPNRDRFVLSKGHAAPVLYAALAEKGFFNKEELMKLRKTRSNATRSSKHELHTRSRYVYWFTRSRYFSGCRYGISR